MTFRERVYRTRAVVLRRRVYGDADRIVTVFTPQLGKLEMIAKGVRRPTSRKAGHLELFTHASLLVAQARTWDIITEAETVEGFRYLRDDLNAVAMASYIGELTDAFTEAGDENAPLWELLLLALRAVDDEAQTPGSSSPQVLRHWFELQLLSLTGFQPELFQCLDCAAPLQPVRNYVRLEEGGVLCAECGARRGQVEALEPDVLKVLRHLQRSPWQAVDRLQIRPNILVRTDGLLHRYLLLVLERHLKSTDFLGRLQNIQG